MKFDAVFTVEKEFSKDDFLRELIIELGIQNSTPVDVVDAEFKEVKESVREVIVCTAKVEGTCTASVGYDRQEPYIDYETYKEKVGNSYVTRQRAVTKYRTVTDWQLFSTPYSGEATCTAYNSDEFELDDSEIVSAIKSVNKNSITETGEAEVNPTGLASAIAACELKVEWNAVKFPGDRHKDQKYDSNSDVLSLSCYKMPYYEVVYTYNGNDYSACCFACGDINIFSQTPPNDIDITAVVKEKTEKLEKTQKLSWRLFTVSLIVAAVLCIGLKFPWLFPLPIILLLKAKRDSDVYSKKYRECSDSLSKNIAESKVSALTAALERHGYAPLDKDLNDSLENCSVPGAKELKPIKSRVIWSWVLVVLLTIISVFGINSAFQKDLHSPKQVEINFVSKEAEYDPDASPYINGCYYVRFDCEIEAKKTGVDYLEFKVYVSDKKGNELGFIRSSFSDINADAGDKKVITTSLQENQPEKNEFFTKLYNADFSDLKFEYEIGSIRFSDGKYYYNDEYNQF